MAERQTVTYTANKSGGYDTTYTPYSVKAGTNDSGAIRNRGMNKRHLGFSSGPRNSKTRRGHLMDPWFLTIKDRTKG
jgi:hypothetical protein